MAKGNVSEDVSWAKLMRSVTLLPRWDYSEQCSCLLASGNAVWYEYGSRLNKGSLGDGLMNMNYSIRQN